MTDAEYSLAQDRRSLDLALQLIESLNAANITPDGRSSTGTQLKWEIAKLLKNAESSAKSHLNRIALCQG
jgi:hypothetical protein